MVWRENMKNEHEIKRLDSTKVIFILKGILIGAIAGIIVSLFRLFIEEMMNHLVALYLWFRINPIGLIPWTLVMIIFAVVVGLLIKSEPNIKGSGIPQVEGTLQGEIKLNWFSILWKKFVGGVLSVGSGLFLGREGPSIQLGAMVGQGFGEYTKASTSEKKIFISSGAAAGLGAAFNAPIAGLLFVIEEVHHHFSPLIWLTSLTAALTANLVSLNFFGLKPVLFIADVPSLPLKYYGLLILLGIILGALGYVYQIVLLSLPQIYKKLIYPNISMDSFHFIDNSSCFLFSKLSWGRQSNCFSYWRTQFSFNRVDLSIFLTVSFFYDLLWSEPSRRNFLTNLDFRSIDRWDLRNYLTSVVWFRFPLDSRLCNFCYGWIFHCNW